MSATPQLVLNVLATFGVYSLATLGFLLIFSVKPFFNFSAGVPVLLAPYLVLALQPFVPGPAVAIGLTVLLLALLGWAFWEAGAEPLFRRIHSDTILLIVTLSLYTVVSSLIALLFGQQAISISAEDLGYVRLPLAVQASSAQVASISVAIIVVPAFWSFWSRSLAGLSLRAAADDPFLADVVGVPVRKQAAIAYAAGFMLLGAASLMQATDVNVRPDFGFALVVVAMVAVAAAPATARVEAAVLASFVIAAGEAIISLLLGDLWSRCFALGLLVTLLIARSARRGRVRRLV
jgi:branched-chain amino acid transport system permease protein